MDAQRSIAYSRNVFAAVFAVVGMVLFLQTASAASTDTVQNWAWSPNTGWISMNCTNDASCAVNGYGATITTTPGFSDRADLSGWAWSDLVGWICFGVTCSGTTPEGGASYAQYRATLAAGTKSDQFIGWARVQALGDSGWISLNCENLGSCAVSPFFVGLDNATGDFNAPGDLSGHWAWTGLDDGTGLGWIDFSRVNTVWTFGSIGNVVRPEGIFEPVAAGLAGTHLHTFTIMLTGLSASPDNLVQCDILLPDGSTKVLSRDVGSLALRDVAFDLMYTVQATDTIDDNKPWIIQECRLLGIQEATACTAHTDCPFGRRCDDLVSGGKCRSIADSTARKRPIFTHGNLWTGLGAAEDQYRAIKCHAGFSGEYLKNAAFCDFTGDAAFSMLMRRGVPVEGDCGDGIDNDGNGQIDCEDRYCQGLSYLCASHVPTQCVPGSPSDGIVDCSESSYVVGSGNLCCANQAIQSTSSLHHVVNGVECSVGDPNDGYFDCACTTQSDFNASPSDDCFAPGAQPGGLCCAADDVVTRL